MHHLSWTQSSVIKGYSISMRISSSHPFRSKKSSSPCSSNTASCTRISSLSISRSSSQWQQVVREHKSKLSDMVFKLKTRIISEMTRAGRAGGKCSLPKEKFHLTYNTWYSPKRISSLQMWTRKSSSSAGVMRALISCRYPTWNKQIELLRQPPYG